MKVVSTIVKIIFIINLCLLIPLAQPSVDIIAFQQTETTKLIRITQPDIKVSSDSLEGVLLNISYVDPVDHSLTEKFSGFFTKSQTIKISKPGIYEFEILTTTLSTITINGKGIFVSHLALFIVSLLAIMIVLTRDYIVNYSV